MLKKSRQKRLSCLSSGALPTKGLVRKDGLIRVVRPNVAVRKRAEPQDVAQLSGRVVAPEPDSLNNLRTRPLLDWAQAVRVATARLKEKLDMLDGSDIPEIAEMAEELAVFICVYGKLAEEVDRMEACERTADKTGYPIKQDLHIFGDALGGA